MSRESTRTGDPSSRVLSMTASEPSLLLVDGHAYAYRAFHAIRDLSSPAGQPTNAIFGFVKAVLGLSSSLAPTHLAVVWDGGLASERLALLPEYKAQRPPMPAALAAQLDGMVAWLEASRIVSFCQDGVEADDAIATLACREASDRARVVIASADKDFMQLVSPRIGLLNPNDKTVRIWSAEDVVAKTGVTPDQVVDWLCLVGDAVDNIPGVPGVGAKTASALLGEFGSCRRLLEEARSDPVGSNPDQPAQQRRPLEPEPTGDLLEKGLGPASVAGSIKCATPRCRSTCRAVPRMGLPFAARGNRVGGLPPDDLGPLARRASDRRGVCAARGRWVSTTITGARRLANWRRCAAQKLDSMTTDFIEGVTLARRASDHLRFSTS